MSLTTAQKKRLAALPKIKGATVEEYSKSMVKFLESEGIEGVENSSIDDLLDYCEAFSEVEEVEKLDELDELEELDDSRELTLSNFSEETEYDELVEELEENGTLKEDYAELSIAQIKKQILSKFPYVKKPQIENRSRQELVDILNEDLEIEEEEVEEVKEIKEVKIDDTSFSTKFETFDPKNIDEYDELIEKLFPQFSTNEYEVKRLKSGFTVRLLLKDSRPTVLNFDTLKVVNINGEQHLLGDAYFNKLKTSEELINFLPERFRSNKIGMFRGETHPSIKKVTDIELKEILQETGIFTESIARAKNEDNKLSKNRAQLERMAE